jgi:hypothetical protein
MLIQLEDKQLQWFGHLKRMEITRIQRRALELKFKGGRPRTRWFNQVPEDIKMEGKSWQEIEKERLWENRTDWRLIKSDGF